MRTWIKGGILVAAIYLLLQLVDDFFYVFLSITPFEKVRYLLYFDFLNLHDLLLGGLSGWVEDSCNILYILAIGFIVGIIVGGIVGMFKKERIRREIVNQHRAIQDGRLRENLMKKHKVGEKEETRKKEKEQEEERKEEEKKKEEERKKKDEEDRKREEERIKEEEEVPDIEIIPLKVYPKKKKEKIKSMEKRRKKKK